MSTPRYDVVVVGGGAAGMSAALEAEEAGASVLLVESQGQLGGSSALSGGIIMAAGTSVQRAAGVEDDPASLWHEYLLFNQYKVGPSVARQLAFGSAPAIEWLIGLGVEFAKDLIYGAEENVPRSHLPLTAGAGIVEVLSSHVRERDGIDIALGRRITRVMREGGRVVGVAVDDDEVRAGGVVLTCGGLGANPSLWQAHLPSAMGAGASAWYIGAPGAQGDALALAAQAGAEVVGHDRALILPTPDFFTNLEVYFPGWLVMVNRGGRRVVDEGTSYAVMQVAHRDHGPLFTIIDDAAKQAARMGAAAERPSMISEDPEEKHPPIAATTNWNSDTIDQMVAAGKVRKADTLPELGRLLGVDGAGLTASMERYNSFVAAGEDRDFYKSAKSLRPVSTPPFYGVEMRLGIVCLTSVGPAIDAEAHAVAPGGQPIPGLYAAGECAGGVLGDVYMGSGNSYANCLVFGRTAGRTAAREARALSRA